MTKTILSALKTGDKFSFDSAGKYKAIYDHSGPGYFAFLWDRGNIFEPIQKGKVDCQVFKFGNDKQNPVPSLSL